MKYLLVLVLSLLLTNGICQSSTEINVRFIGFDKSKDKGFVEVFVPDVVDPFRQQLVINQKGEFVSNLIITETREVLINYDDRSIPVIVTPGDRITLSLSLPALLKTRTVNNFKISGNNSATNNLVLSKGKLINDWIQSSSNAYAAPKTMDCMAYKEMRINEMNNQLKSLDQILGDNKITDVMFISWAKSKIRNAAAIDLSLFPFMGRMSKDISDKSEYFNFMTLINPNEKQSVWYESYFNYLDILCTSLQIIANTSDEYKDQRKSLNNQSNFFPVIYSVFSRFQNGPGKELLIARLFQSMNKTVPSQYWDSLPGKLDPKLIHIIRRDEIAESKPITELIGSFLIDEKDKRALLKIYSDAKGKIIYHDFLINGCAPCLRELSQYKGLMDKAGNDVVFIFLGVKMKPDELKNMIGKYNLPGEQYVLSKNQFAFFERYFNVRGFPHHKIVDKKGMIITGKAHGLSNYPIESKLKKLEEVR